MTRGSPHRRAGARWSSSSTVGRTTRSTVWEAMAQCSATRSRARIRWFTFLPMVRRRSRLISRFPTRKSFALFIVVSVRRARSSLKYCFTRVDL